MSPFAFSLVGSAARGGFVVGVTVAQLIMVGMMSLGAHYTAASAVQMTLVLAAAGYSAYASRRFRQRVAEADVLTLSEIVSQIDTRPAMSDPEFPNWCRRQILHGYALHSDGSIQFKPCGVTSYNKNDVANNYCGRCDRHVGLLVAMEQDALLADEAPAAEARPQD
jgi:hypothetical protein